MLVASSSPVKLSKSTVFSGVNFREKFEDVLQKQFLSVGFETIEIRLFYRKLGSWVADSEQIRYVYSTEILSNTATIWEINSTEIDSFFLLKIVQRDTGLHVTERDIVARHYSTELQTAKQTLKTLKTTQLNLLPVTFLAI